jgi:hypothetical protein
MRNAVKTWLVGAPGVAAALLGLAGVLAVSACGHSQTEIVHPGAGGLDGQAKTSLPVHPDGVRSSVGIDLPSLASMETAEVARLAVVDEAPIRKAAAMHLRSMGQAGLHALEAAWATDVDCLRTVGSLDADEALEMMLAFHETVEPFKWEDKELSEAAIRDPKRHRQALEEAFSTVTAQHDGLYSGIYWETDLVRAREVSRSTGKPILSLRVLGRLDDAMC